ARSATAIPQIARRPREGGVSVTEPAHRGRERAGRACLVDQMDAGAGAGEEQTLALERNHRELRGGAERGGVEQGHRPLAAAGGADPLLGAAPEPERAPGEARHQRDQYGELQNVGEGRHLRRSVPAIAPSVATTSTTRMPKRPFTVTTSPRAMSVPFAMMSSSSCDWRSSSTMLPSASSMSSESFSAVLPTSTDRRTEMSANRPKLRRLKASSAGPASMMS